MAKEALQPEPAAEAIAAATATQTDSPAGDTAVAAQAAVTDDLDLAEAVPNYRSNPLPEYPYLARQRRWQGTVWLLVDVSADGLVNGLRIEQSCGHSVLDRAASRTVQRWRFTPARRGGVPVASRVRIPVRFHLEDS